MIYQASITTPKNTLASSPKKTVLKVTKGLLFHYSVYIPSGAWGLSHCYIKDGLYQVAPADPGETFHGDNQYLPFDDMYLKFSPPFQFQIYTYNLDTVFEHEIIVRLGVVSKLAYILRFMPYYGKEEAEKALRERAKEQEAERQAVLSEPFPWLGES